MRGETNWKLKLKALLHDPPHKIWVMFSKEGRKININKTFVHPYHKWHEKVAEHLLNILFYNECIEEEDIRKADTIASALSRIVTAPEFSDENTKKEYEKITTVSWEEIKFVDIFSLKQTKLETPDHQKIEEIFEKISKVPLKGKERDKFLFFYFWRFYPEIFPWINTHPADSRAPNHSIYHHLVQTSAIISALPRPAFLLFIIGPVQSFISRARKTQDLWAGSYLLSYLTWESMKPIIEKLGPDNIIFPNLLKQPLMDKYLKNLKFNNKTFENLIKNLKLPFSFYDTPDKLTIANFPNKFLAIIPFDKNLAIECENRFRYALKRLAQKTIEYLQQKSTQNISILQTNPERIKQDIETHLLSYFQVYWVVLPWIPDNNIKNLQSGLNEYKTLIGETEIYNTINTIIRYPYYEPNIGDIYPLLLELTEKLLGARKSIRNFEFLEEEGDKCTLCGEFNQLWLLNSEPQWKDKEKRKNNRDEWNKLIPEVRKNERFCGICLVKRFFPEILAKTFDLKIDIRFPSTAEIASIGEKRRLDKETKEKLKDLIKKFKNKFSFPRSSSVPKLKEDPLYKIDGMFLMGSTYREDYFEKEFGEKIKKEDFEEIVEFLRKNKIKPTTYYTILQMDGDNMGKWLKGEFNPEIEEVIHPKVKEALRSLPFESKKDLLRLLHKKHPNTPSIHQAFSSKLSKFALEKVKNLIEEEYYGKLIYAGGDDILAFLPIEEVLNCAYNLQKIFKEILSNKASMSAGIVIVHHKYPLYLALNEVNLAEKRAKSYFGKDAFCIKILTHSGEVRETGGKWELIDFLNKLICKFKAEEISSRFPYQFLEITERLLKEDKKIDENDQIYPIIKNELKRIYERKTGDPIFLEEILNLYKTYSFSYFNFVNIFIIANFISKEIKDVKI